MWPIINKLFIWRETCFFDGSELKKQAAIPYFISKELSLEFLFLLTRVETVCKLFSSSEETPVFHARIHCLLTGQFWAPKLPIISYFLSQLYLLACKHLIRMEERLSACPCFSQSGLQCEADSYSGAVWEARAGASHACILLSSLVIILKVSCALFLVLNRRRGKLITGCHTLRWGDCEWHNSEIFHSICNSSWHQAETQLNNSALWFLLYFVQLWFDLTCIAFIPGKRIGSNYS